MRTGPTSAFCKLLKYCANTPLFYVRIGLSVHKNVIPNVFLNFFMCMSQKQEPPIQWMQWFVVVIKVFVECYYLKSAR